MAGPSRGQKSRKEWEQEEQGVPADGHRYRCACRKGSVVLRTLHRLSLWWRDHKLELWVVLPVLVLAASLPPRAQALEKRQQALFAAGKGRAKGIQGRLPGVDLVTLHPPDSAPVERILRTPGSTLGAQMRRTCSGTTRPTPISLIVHVVLLDGDLSV